MRTFTTCFGGLRSLSLSLSLSLSNDGDALKMHGTLSGPWIVQKLGPSLQLLQSKIILGTS